MHAKFLAPLCMLAAIGATTARAADFDSVYTDLNLDECTVQQADDFGASWACPGYKGTPLYVAEGDLRFMVSYGFGAEDEMAATQTPPYFNYLGPKIEWRLSNASGGFKPIATIVRYFTQLEEGEKEGQVLVVTQLVPGNTCHIAYIDALANPDANEQARKYADKAGTFDCETDEIAFSSAFSVWER